METSPAANPFAHIDCISYSTGLSNNTAGHTTTRNRKPKMAEQKNIQLLQTAKFYTVLNETLHENFVFIDEDNAELSLIDNDIPVSKNIILVLFDNLLDKDLYSLFRKFQSRLHTIIYYNDIPLPEFLLKNNTCVIKTNSVQHSVTEAYRIARDGQTILFPRTDADFDFFAHIFFQN